MNEYDVLIVGGGMVGASLACALGGSPLRVGLIEAASPQMPTLRDYDLRVSAITPASRALFEHLGTWAAIVERRVSPIREMRIWDADGSGRLHFDSAELGEPCLGYIIENSVITIALWERLRAHGNVTILCPATVERITFGDNHAVATLNDRRSIRARLIIAADGAGSPVRTLAGITQHCWDYRQKAIVATVRTAHSHQHVAFQRFLPTGPLAFLPLHEPCACSIVWTCEQGYADGLMELDASAFGRKLQEALGDDALGELALASERRAFALGLAHADAYVRHRLALIGDAAHRMHPLAGQGANVGFADAATLAEVVLEAHARGRDAGRLSTLRRYERWRKEDNLTMLALTDMINRLFRADNARVRRLGDLGLRAVNAIEPLKNHLMTRAMGLRGDLPRLSRRQAK